MMQRREAEGRDNHPHAKAGEGLVLPPIMRTAIDMPVPGHEQAEKFLIDCGLTPTPDAVEQLVVAFLPSLKIMCERGYHPNGNTWRVSGWRGMLHEIRKKGERLWFRSWVKGQVDEDSARDLINYAGFYLRLVADATERDNGWGEWGAPGQR